MRNLSKVYAGLTAFLIFSCTETITETITIVEVEEFDNDLFYLSTSVCNCNRSGIELLEALIEDEKQIYKIMFNELRYNCLSKYGTNLFLPSSCNDTDYMGDLMDSLYVLGIDINDF